MTNDDIKNQLLTVAEGVSDEMVEELEDTNTRGVIVEILRNGQIAYISSGLEQITGFKTSHVIGTDIHNFIEQLLGASSAKQLWPLISEVLRGTRQFLESQAKGINVITEEEKLYLLQLEASSQNFNRSILFIQDQSEITVSGGNLNNSQLRSMRILEKGNLFFLRSDLNLNVKEILGDTEKILGLKNHQLEENPNLWLDILSENQDGALKKAFYRLIKKPRSFTKEISFQNFSTKQTCYIMFSAVPIFEDHELVGWEGFGLDITDKKTYELKLEAQTKRYNTLYQILSCVQNSTEPKQIANLSLDSLISATNSEAGGIWFGVGVEDKFELLAIRGVPEPNFANMWEYLQKEGNLVDIICHNKYGVVLQDFAKEADDYALQCLAPIYGSMIAMPLIVNDLGNNPSIVGAFFLASKKSYHYSNEDLELLDTVASQIAKLTYNAEYLLAEKKQADSVNTLFLLSKSLTKSLTHLEIGQNSCSVIEQLFSVKRIWFGVMNNSGSHIQGIYGKGPGMRQNINEIQIELALRHDFMDQALSEKRPMLLDRNDRAECSGINRIIDILKPTCILILPLVSIGQVVGLIAIEPNLNSRERMLANMSLLTSISNEVASALLTRRFELQIANSDKMKTVSLLAAGVAHNFNNLLQAIMGQASILETKFTDDSPFKKPLQDICSYASKGADLIKQMSYLREIENLNSDVVDLVDTFENEILKQKEYYQDQVQIRLVKEVSQALVFADQQKLLGVLSNLIKNSAESMEKSIGGEILIRISSRRVFSHEVSAELPPGKYFQVDVIDDGHGMDQEQLKHCFEPFYTTKNRDLGSGVSYSASGLGLSNSYSIVRGHGGVIVASSHLNQGSTFSIYLPHYNKDKISFKAVEGSAEEFKQSFVMISGIEKMDERILKIIEQQNFKLFQLNNRGQMITYLAKANFNPQYLMMDLDQQGTDIIDFLNIIRDRFNNIKFILTTSNHQTWDASLRFFDNLYYLDKPLSVIDFEELLINFSENTSNNTLIDQVVISRSEEDEDD